MREKILLLKKFFFWKIWVKNISSEEKVFGIPVFCLDIHSVFNDPRGQCYKTITVIFHGKLSQYKTQLFLGFNGFKYYFNLQSYCSNLLSFQGKWARCPTLLKKPWSQLLLHLAQGTKVSTGYFLWNFRQQNFLYCEATTCW